MMWLLGGSEKLARLAGARTFRGERIVTVREHYLKDGAWLPCKRGMNLAPEEFGCLCTQQQVGPPWLPLRPRHALSVVPPAA